MASKATLALLFLAAGAASGAVGATDDPANALNLIKDEVASKAADGEALAAALKTKLETKVSGGPAPGTLDANTPLTLVTVANGTSTLKCGRSQQCIDQSGLRTFGAVAALTPTLTLSETPWTDAATYTIDLAAIPYVPGANPATFFDSAGHVFNITKSGKLRVMQGNGLPSTPMGDFPVSNTTAAYQYYSSLPGGTDPRTGQAYLPDGTADEIPITAYNLLSSVPLVPIPSGYYPINSLIVGVTLTGAVWHVEAAPDSDGVYYNPINVLPLDQCFGHPYSNQYHHHGYSWKCMRAQFASTKGHSPLAGYALDGHGIYGPRDVDGEMITNAKLDKCHGHYGPVEWEGKPAVMYHYHLNREFPYSVGCFRGSVNYFEALGSSDMRETLLPLYSESAAATKLLNLRAEVEGAVGVKVNGTSEKVNELSSLLTEAATKVEQSS